MEIEKFEKAGEWVAVKTTPHFPEDAVGMIKLKLGSLVPDIILMHGRDGVLFISSETAQALDGAEDSFRCFSDAVRSAYESHVAALQQEKDEAIRRSKAENNLMANLNSMNEKLKGRA